MSVAAAVAGIQTVNAAITGVTSAPSAMPGSLNTAMLPFAITIPGPCEWVAQSAGFGHQFRVYMVRFYVSPIAQDVTADGGFQDACTLIQAVGDAYIADTTFGGVVTTVRGDGPQPAITDGGVRGDMVYGAAGTTAYWGFEFQVVAKEVETW